MACLTEHNAIVECAESSRLGVNQVMSVCDLAKPVPRTASFSQESDLCPARCALELLTNQCELLRRGGELFSFHRRLLSMHRIAAAERRGSGAAANWYDAPAEAQSIIRASSRRRLQPLS